jgi:DNA-binding Xre family transcriptional regulator
MSTNVGYRWHLRRLMAERDMFATTDLVPLLSMRGITLSREQVYRMVAGTPQRLSLATLAALCDILDCQPGDLVEPVTARARPRATAATAASSAVRARPAQPGPQQQGPAPVRPLRARVSPGRQEP